MNARRSTIPLLLGYWLISVAALPGVIPQNQIEIAAVPRTFSARGVVQELPAEGLTVVLKHEAISNYMDAMTMPFKVKAPSLLAGLHPGDQVTFRLNVADDESWVDQFHKIGTAPVDLDRPPTVADISPAPGNAFMDYTLTNELGQKVSLHDFRGQALAITFFYTRCPLPDFCPRLSKNFQEAAQKLRGLPGAPTNWHFLSISFDTAFDTPGMLKAYGEIYGYEANEWSFLTGSPDNIRELARISGVSYVSDSGAFKHNFRTLIIDPAGRLQMIFPMGGDLSDDIVSQIIKAAAVTNQTDIPARNH